MLLKEPHINIYIYLYIKVQKDISLNPVLSICSFVNPRKIINHFFEVLVLHL